MTSLSYLFAAFYRKRRRRRAVDTSLAVTAVAKIADCCKSPNQSDLLSIDFERRVLKLFYILH